MSDDLFQDIASYLAGQRRWKVSPDDIDDVLDLPADAICDYAAQWGRCPDCGVPSNTYLNDGPAHWFICDDCRTRWLVGRNLFSGWCDLPVEELTAQREQLAGYREVEPI